jgi:hypothetical protein
MVKYNFINIAFPGHFVTQKPKKSKRSPIVSYTNLAVFMKLCPKFWVKKIVQKLFGRNQVSKNRSLVSKYFALSAASSGSAVWSWCAVSPTACAWST